MDPNGSEGESEVIWSEGKFDVCGANSEKSHSTVVPSSS